MNDTQDYLIVGFSARKKFSILSWLIQKVEGVNFSHVYINLNSNSLNRELIYQASGLTVNFCNKQIFYSKNKNVAQFFLPITKEQKRQILQACVDNVGKPYGILDLLGIGLVRLANVFGFKIRNFFSDGSKTYICSEITAVLLLSLGFKFEDLDIITPKDIYDKLRGQNGTSY